MIEYKWQKKPFFSLAPDQGLAEQSVQWKVFDWKGCRQETCYLLQVQAVHFWFFSWEKIAIKFLFHNNTRIIYHSRTAVFTFLYITNFSVNEHQYFGIGAMRYGEFITNFTMTSLNEFFWISTVIKGCSFDNKLARNSRRKHLPDNRTFSNANHYCNILVSQTLSILFQHPFLCGEVQVLVGFQHP